jgi:hypothetical protein
MVTPQFIQESFMKSLLAIFLLLPTLAMAQPSAGQGQAPSFEEFKKGMQPVLTESLPSMKKTRACLAKAASNADVEKCMQEMMVMAKALQKKLGMPDAPGKNPAEMTKPPEGFEWNEEAKRNMLNNMDQSIQQSEAMHECLKASNTADEMNSCMRSKMSVR